MTFAAGSEIGPWTIDAVDTDSIETFAVVLDDPNPIHLDVSVVEAAGLGTRVINQGPANVAYVLNMLLATAPGATVRDLRVRLTSNVFASDRVTAAGRVETVAEEGDGLRLDCGVWLDVEGGDRALEGTATLDIPAP